MEHIQSIQKCDLIEVLNHHTHIFNEALGTLQGYEAQLYVDPQAKSSYCKAHPVPYSMCKAGEQELHCLVSEGFLEPIQFAEWASPFVLVLKVDGQSDRICGDFKLLNQACNLTSTPQKNLRPFCLHSGRHHFYKTGAYQQVLLVE